MNESKKKIQITVSAHESRYLDRAVQDICEQAKRTGAEVVGPIPLPTKKSLFSVTRSPFVNKTAQEQFMQTTHKRAIQIRNPSPSTIDALRSLSLEQVDIQLK